MSSFSTYLRSYKWTCAFSNGQIGNLMNVKEWIVRDWIAGKREPKDPEGSIVFLERFKRPIVNFQKQLLALDEPCEFDININEEEFRMEYPTLRMPLNSFIACVSLASGLNQNVILVD